MFSADRRLGRMGGGAQPGRAGPVDRGRDRGGGSLAEEEKSVEISTQYAEVRTRYSVLCTRYWVLGYSEPTRLPWQAFPSLGLPGSLTKDEGT